MYKEYLIIKCTLLLSALSLPGCNLQSSYKCRHIIAILSLVLNLEVELQLVNDVAYLQLHACIYTRARARMHIIMEKAWDI